MYVAPLKTRRNWRMAGLLRTGLLTVLLASILLGRIYVSEGPVFGLGFSPLQACNARSGQQVTQTMQGSSRAQVTYQQGPTMLFECQARRLLLLWRASSIIWTNSHICIGR